MAVEGAKGACGLDLSPPAAPVPAPLRFQAPLPPPAAAAFFSAGCVNPRRHGDGPAGARCDRRAPRV